VPVVTRIDLRDVLTRWQSRRLTHRQVYDWANERSGPGDWECEDDVVAQVLIHLDVLDVNLTTPEDVPAFLAMLDAKTDADAMQILEDHSKTFDLEARIGKWKDDPFYAPFCRPVGE